MNFEFRIEKGGGRAPSSAASRHLLPREKASATSLRDRFNRIELIDHPRPFGNVAIARDAEPYIELRRVRRGACQDMDEAATLEDDDLPVDIGILNRLVDGAEGNVFGNEVAHVPLCVVPIGKTGKLASCRADEIQMLAEFLRLAHLDCEIADDRKVTQIGGREGGRVVGIRQLQLCAVAEDSH